MQIFETKKRRILRAASNAQNIAYGNLGEPVLSVEVQNISANDETRYNVRISFADLAELVRAADKYAVEVQVKGLENWREFGNTSQPAANTTREAILRNRIGVIRAELIAKGIKPETIDAILNEK